MRADHLRAAALRRVSSDTLHSWRKGAGWFDARVRLLTLTRWLTFALTLALLSPVVLHAHALNITQVQVTFDAPGSMEVRVDIDLTPFLLPEGYHALSLEPAAAQRAAVTRLLPEIHEGLQLFVGTGQLRLDFQDCTLPTGSLEMFLDPAAGKYAVLRFRATLPADTGPLQLVVPYGTKVPHPVAFTARVPSAGISAMSMIDEAGTESDPFDWANFVGGVARAPVEVELVRLPWYRELGVYLRTGFLHIVPGGTDHILFVLGLFFLGLTWRKLLIQTSVFTVAHATTLFLSTYGIFSLPSRWVEPAIALSITFIALENVLSAKLGPGRLAVVFGFGLVHGLGFASSLQEVPFPKHDFLLALLGFNFGVDFGQLFVIALAILAVGWFRAKPWFRARIAVPCSLVIAAIGLFWFGQRVIFYWVS